MVYDVRFALGFALSALLTMLWLLILRRRKTAMEKLATRWNLQYRGKQLPSTFLMKSKPRPAARRKVFNVLEGTLDGNTVVIFDSIVNGTFFGQRAVFCTLIACQMADYPFPKSAKEKIIHSNGWTALYRLAELSLPGTIGTERIEQLLAELSAE